MSDKKIIGYTTGVYDMFHIGHLNILKNAKEHCDYLVVGVTVDELVSYKNTATIIPFEERIQIVESCKYVDEAIPQVSMDKMEAWETVRFDRMFVGSDWKGTDKWNKLEKEFKKLGAEIIYFPYTEGTSSSKLKVALNALINISAERGYDEA